MKLPLALRPAAKTDLRDAQNWYERQRSGLGDRFVDAVEHTFDQIGAAPELQAVMFQNVRCGKIRGFPYIVYYRVLADRVEVIAVLHASRDPRIWKNRL